jgi:hypothetical protein
MHYTLVKFSFLQRRRSCAISVDEFKFLLPQRTGMFVRAKEEQLL